jgi:ribosomal RNA-processing protein 9
MLSEDKKKIESLGVLSGPEDGASHRGQQNGILINGHSPEPKPIVGIINDIAVFERGDRGIDGFCVIAAVSKEHRLGRWRTWNNGRNGGVLFEVPRIQKPMLNGTSHSDEDE